MLGALPRPLTLVTLLVAVAVALSACGSTNKSATKPAQSQPKSNQTASSGTSNHLSLVSPGYLTVGSDTSYPPMESKDPQTQQYVGADVDLAQALAKAMGLKGAQIKSGIFDSLIPSLNAHRYDVVMSSMNDTPDRAKKVDFVDYMRAREGILVFKSKPIKTNGYSGLCGKTVTVERGTTEELGMEQANKTCSSKINILASATDSDAFQAFNSGHADAYTSDLPVIIHYVQSAPTRFQQAGPSITASANYGIALNKGDGQLKTALQDAVAKIRANGEYSKILKKWGVSEAGLSK